MPENSPDQSQESQLTLAPEFLDQLKQNLIKNLVNKSHLDAVSATGFAKEFIEKLVPSISASLNWFGFTPRAKALIGEISQKSGDAPIDVVGKALALYKLALNAHKEGKTIAILDNDLEIDQEIEGFEPRNKVVAKEAKETVAGPG